MVEALHFLLPERKSFIHHHQEIGYPKLPSMEVILVKFLADNLVNAIRHLICNFKADQKNNTLVSLAQLLYYML